MKLNIQELAQKVNEAISGKTDVTDGRQSSTVSERRIRDYMTKGLLSKPMGQGKEKWFTEGHVEELVALRVLQHSGLPEQYLKETTSSQSNTVADNSYMLQYNDLTQKSNDLTEALKNGTLDESHFSPEVMKMAKEASVLLNEKQDSDMQNDALSFLNGIQAQGSNRAISMPLQLPTMSASLPDLLKSQSQSYQAASRAAGADALPKSVMYGTTQSVLSPQDNSLINSLKQRKKESRGYIEYSLDEDDKIFLKVDYTLPVQEQENLVSAVREALKNSKKTN